MTPGLGDGVEEGIEVEGDVRQQKSRPEHKKIIFQFFFLNFDLVSGWEATHWRSARALQTLLLWWAVSTCNWLGWFNWRRWYRCWLVNKGVTVLCWWQKPEDWWLDRCWWSLGGEQPWCQRSARAWGRGQAPPGGDKFPVMEVLCWDLGITVIVISVRFEFIPLSFWRAQAELPLSSLGLRARWSKHRSSP